MTRASTITWSFRRSSRKSRSTSSLTRPQNTPSKAWHLTQLSSVVVVLNEVDNLSRNAQAGLRRTMEKFTGSCRLLLCCENSGRIIPPIRSRCLCIRIAAPTPFEVVFPLLSHTDHEHPQTHLSDGESSSGCGAAATHHPSRRGLLLSSRPLTAICDAPCCCWRRARCRERAVRRERTWS